MLGVYTLAHNTECYLDTYANFHQAVQCNIGEVIREENTMGKQHYYYY